MTYREQLNEIETAIQKMNEERKQLIVSQNSTAIRVTLNQIYFQTQSLKENIKKTSEMMSDITMLLKAMQNYYQDSVMVEAYTNFEKNNEEIKSLLNKQTQLLNSYLTCTEFAFVFNGKEG